MYHNELHLLGIERWARRLAWYYLILSLLNALASAYYSVAVWVNPERMGLFVENNVWNKLLTVFATFENVFSFVFYYLLLQGIVKLIRYLLAMKNEFQDKYAR